MRVEPSNLMTWDGERFKEDTCLSLIMGSHAHAKLRKRVTHRINSHLGQKITHQVNMNDLKQMNILNTSSWTLNKQVLCEVKAELEIPRSVDDMELFLHFLILNHFTLDNLSNYSSSIFISPEWPFPPWI